MGCKHPQRLRIPILCGSIQFEKNEIHHHPMSLLLEVDKYAPGKIPKWKRVKARFPDLYKARLAETDAATRGARLRQAVSAAG